MEFEQLIDFVDNRMSMSHVYQPLMIRALVDAGGSATLRQLAQAFLVQDESQLLHYERTIKKMPLRVLRDRGVVKRRGDVVSLTTSALDLKQKARIRMLCEQRLQSYVEKRGLGIWDYRLLESDPVPDSVYYNVLKKARGRCELCGATKVDRPLHVDHILPRSKGGKNTPENLQVLCQKCNLAKGNRDSTDLRDSVTQDRDASCVFCRRIEGGETVHESDLAVALRDAYPVSDGHLLIVPRRHTPDYFTMTEAERLDSDRLARVARNHLLGQDDAITGFNVGSNAGTASGQTVFHAHIHLIPRRDGDTPRPRGGVRGAIPDKMSY